MIANYGNARMVYNHFLFQSDITKNQFLELILLALEKYRKIRDLDCSKKTNYCLFRFLLMIVSIGKCKWLHIYCHINKI
ncbi:unnamed protein product [Blepharisma stoltei]|uniref:Transposase n=1 Tax=Blepharisma stoltei TaxID=1481888 RepID=A0AAU9JXX5_9CILI|nr:unnamed protein product [Blepharisma stoltei]